MLAFKGGSGKSTLAVHLAVIAAQAGRRVLLVDTDPQRSAAGWWRSRKAEAPELVECDAARLSDVLKAARADGVDLAVVDTRPSVDATTAAVARLADLVLIPTRPAIFDLRAIAATVQVVQASKRPGLIVLNATPAPRGVLESSLTAEARTALASYALPVATAAVSNRAALAHALVDGRAVTEFEPGGKAALELQSLYRIVKESLWPAARK